MNILSFVLAFVSGASAVILLELLALNHLLEPVRNLFEMIPGLGGS